MPSPRRVHEPGQPACGADRPRHDGPAPRPGAFPARRCGPRGGGRPRRRHRGRRRGPTGPPERAGTHQRQHRLLRRRGTHRVPRGDWAGPGRGRCARDHREAAVRGHVQRYNPALQSARKRLEAGELGTVYQIITRRQGPFPGRVADVGVVKDLATHDIDLTAWVTGQAFTSVSARTAFRSGREHEDLVAVVGSLADGTVTNHLVNWLSPLKERVTVITGERGTFVADTLVADLTFYANGSVPTTWSGIAQFRGVSEGDMVRYAIAKPEPLRVEHENFRDAVLGKNADIVTMEQGLTTVVVAEAMIESARTGRTIDLRN